MKKFILIILCLAFAFVASAQTSATTLKTENVDVVRTLYSLPGDTIIKNGSKTQVISVSNWCESLRLQTKYVRKTGNYTKAKTVIYGSMDNLTFAPIDSITVASTSATSNGISTLLAVNKPFIKLVTTAIDSTQKIQLYFTILINKN